MKIEKVLDVIGFPKEMGTVYYLPVYQVFHLKCPCCEKDTGGSCLPYLKNGIVYEGVKLSFNSEGLLQSTGTVDCYCGYSFVIKDGETIQVENDASWKSYIE